MKKNLAAEISEMMSSAAKNLAHVAASSSFDLWSRKDFRLYIEFANIPQVEQDRIFNELEVSVLGLFDLQFETIKNDNPQEEKEVVMGLLQAELVPSFLHSYDPLWKLLRKWFMTLDVSIKQIAALDGKERIKN
ncbi:MAG: hypothetical protein A3F31_03255 [Candidatus Levybacteria bacterium RIFCSPHIGHO2_12_FULL_38_12]|nr:MAG: hypothetical protein A2770_03680 [Candidatus Levybacteria bacterium RIFCSPHIGHO2_01_FULL_38_12]OGH22118.1 MAG: hypothetical protein A3D75_02625 [Candidatus Levybacteria bacterium RIFCSPHIGHO2_02_FULL_37_18]OGH22966.1 MAG: hypothetical protein A3F31_03255 [Candidatus Levybacteria bacterium RIFCSPHIGHO2_12_FULL_38_12]